MLDVEPVTATPEARLGFVHDEQGTEASRHLEEPLQVTLWREDHSTGGQDRFHNDRGKIIESRTEHLHGHVETRGLTRGIRQLYRTTVARWRQELVLIDGCWLKFCLPRDVRNRGQVPCRQ